MFHFYNVDNQQQALAVEYRNDCQKETYETVRSGRMLDRKALWKMMRADDVVVSAALLIVGQSN